MSWFEARIADGQERLDRAKLQHYSLCATGGSRLNKEWVACTEYRFSCCQAGLRSPHAKA